MMLNLPDWLVHPMACIEMVTRLAALSTILAATEVLAARKDFACEPGLAWDNLKRFSRLPAEGRLEALLGVVFRYPGYMALHWVWLLAAVGLAFSLTHPVLRPGLLYLVFVIQALISLRQCSIINFGCDKMRLLLLGALALREIVPDGELLARATLFFIGGQGVLAYFTAGAFHQRLSEWRRGEATVCVLRHPLYGDPLAAEALARHLVVSRLLTWGVSVLEIGFPLALLGGVQTMLPALAGTLLMHVLLGYLSGLPQFVWAFLASYPALLFMSEQVRKYIGQ